MKLKPDPITSADIVSQRKRHVTSYVAGVLIDGEAYTRSDPFYLNKDYVPRDVVDRFDLIFNTKEQPVSDIHLFQFKNAIVAGQGSVILSDGSILFDSVAEFLIHNLTPDHFSKLPDGFEVAEPTTRVN